MTLTRRTAIAWASTWFFGCRPSSSPAVAVPANGKPNPQSIASAHELPASIRAVAFDAFVLFDPRPFPAGLEARFPTLGTALFEAFRTRLFSYGWLRALGERYVDFWRISEHALDAALAASGLDPSAGERAELLDLWGSLPPWPDARSGVLRLIERGLSVGVLSNWSPTMIEDGLRRIELSSQVHALSTDAARTYKPAPRAYGLGEAFFQCPKEQILFVAFAGWDAAGASWFGMPTVWMNRAASPPEHLDAGIAAEVEDFDGLHRVLSTM